MDLKNCSGTFNLRNFISQFTDFLTFVNSLRTIYVYGYYYYVWYLFHVRSENSDVRSAVLESGLVNNVCDALSFCISATVGTRVTLFWQNKIRIKVYA